jgi:hypothetical protein
MSPVVPKVSTSIQNPARPSEQEKLALNELALAWVNAALASDRVLARVGIFPGTVAPIDAGQDIGA